MARLLRDQVSLIRANEPETRVYPLQRSASDPDLFVLQEHYADETAFKRSAHSTRLNAFRQRVAEQGLAAGAADDAVEVELYRTI